MPELPEMENYKILLKWKLMNEIITDVQINREKSINIHPDLFKKQCRIRKLLILKEGANIFFFSCKMSKHYYYT